MGTRAWQPFYLLILVLLLQIINSLEATVSHQDGSTFDKLQGFRTHCDDHKKKYVYHALSHAQLYKQFMDCTALLDPFISGKCKKTAIANEAAEVLQTFIKQFKHFFKSHKRIVTSLKDILVIGVEGAKLLKKQYNVTEAEIKIDKFLPPLESNQRKSDCPMFPHTVALWDKMTMYLPTFGYHMSWKDENMKLLVDAVEAIRKFTENQKKETAKVVVEVLYLEHKNFDEYDRLNNELVDVMNSISQMACEAVKELLKSKTC